MTPPPSSLTVVRLSTSQANQPVWQQALADLVSPYAEVLSPADELLSPLRLAQQALSHAPWFWVLSTTPPEGQGEGPCVWAAVYVAVSEPPVYGVLHGVIRCRPQSQRPYKLPQTQALWQAVWHAAQHPDHGLKLLLVEMDDPNGLRRNKGALGFCRRLGFRPLARLGLPASVRLPRAAAGCVLWGKWVTETPLPKG